MALQVLTVCLSGLGALMWLRKNKPAAIVPFVYAAAALIASMPFFVRYHNRGVLGPRYRDKLEGVVYIKGSMGLAYGQTYKPHVSICCRNVIQFMSTDVSSLPLTSLTPPATSFLFLYPPIFPSFLSLFLSLFLCTSSLLPLSLPLSFLSLHLPSSPPPRLSLYRLFQLCETCS